MMSFAMHHVVVIRTQIQLEEEDFARVRDEAARRDQSIAAFVRESVKQALDAREAAGCRDRARELAGKYRSGSSDLARNHDAHLDHGW